MQQLITLSVCPQGVTLRSRAVRLYKLQISFGFYNMSKEPRSNPLNNLNVPTIKSSFVALGTFKLRRNGTKAHN